MTTMMKLHSPPPPPLDDYDSSDSPPPPPPLDDYDSSDSPSPPPPLDDYDSSDSPPPPRPHPAMIQAPPPPPSPDRHDSPSLPSSRSHSSSRGGLIVGIVIGGVLIILALVLIFRMRRRRKKKPQSHSDNALPIQDDRKYRKGSVNPNQTPPRDVDHPPSSSEWGTRPPLPTAQTNSEFGVGRGTPAPLPTVETSGEFGGPPLRQYPLQTTSPMSVKSPFTYNELAAATNGFSHENLLGQGSFGSVHRGVLSDGRAVAVKTLKAGSGNGNREFQAAADAIGSVYHRHLVSLVGYCITGDKKILVNEFVPNKTLEFHLHEKGHPIMDWATRLRVAVGAANGLAYLHEDCDPRIVHRDIKAANVLLNDNFEAMVSDFGLTKLAGENYTHASTRIMGTLGYLAPEYAATGMLTEKSDVFSFGVMLLELITGRRPVNTKNKSMEDSLVDWARPFLSKALQKGDCSAFADPMLEDNYVPEEMTRMVACAAASIRHSARRRPRMIQIVRALEGASPLKELEQGTKPDQSPPVDSRYANANRGIYDTRQYNADVLRFKN